MNIFIAVVVGEYPSDNPNHPMNNPMNNPLNNPNKPLITL